MLITKGKASVKNKNHKPIRAMNSLLPSLGDIHITRATPEMNNKTVINKPIDSKSETLLKKR